MSTEAQRERQERIDDLRRQQQQGATLHGRAQADVAQMPPDRFASVNATTVIGSRPEIAGAYPAASAAHQVQLPDEMPTGYRIDQLEPSTPPVEGQGDSAPADPSGVVSPTSDCGVGPSGDPASDAQPIASSLVGEHVGAGSPPKNKEHQRERRR
jgi:hypothetical protein